MQMLKRILTLSLILLLGAGGCGIKPAGPFSSPTAEVLPPTPTPEKVVHGTSGDVVLGMYPSYLLQRVPYEFERFDSWIDPTGKKLTIAATFMDFEDPGLKRGVPAEMQAAWTRGYTPFVNLSAGNLEVPRSAEEIADGELDPEIQTWARAYARWARSGGKRAFIAPLQEMNGYWTSYGEDPEHFKLAYARIQDIFHQEGVPPRSVSWVFSPNGWSEEGHEFERYYPGDDAVDVVGFNAFNFGTCSAWPKWETYEELYLPYLDRLSAMAPGKPIFISSTGTVAEGGDKGQWLVETYQQLAGYPGLRAILYFNRWETRESLPGCPDRADYRVFDADELQGEPDYLRAISLPEITYYPPDSPAMRDLMFNRP